MRTKIRVSLGAYLLCRWRRQMKLPQTKAAKLLAVDQARYSQFERGVRKPGLEYAVRIQRGTDGAVPVTTWCDPCSVESVAKAS